MYKDKLFIKEKHRWDIKNSEHGIVLPITGFHLIHENKKEKESSRNTQYLKRRCRERYTSANYTNDISLYDESDIGE